MARIFVDGRDEHNGDVTRQLPLLNQGGCFIAIHFRHLHIQQNYREILLQ